MRGSSALLISFIRHNEVVSASNSYSFGVSLGFYRSALASASSLLMIFGQKTWQILCREPCIVVLLW